MRKKFIVLSSFCLMTTLSAFAENKSNLESNALNISESEQVALEEKKAEPIKFTLEPTGRLYVDLAKYFENKQELSSGAAFGDIRLGMKAQMGRWSGEIVFGFAKSNLSFKDIFLKYDLTKTSHLKLGHYVEPLGLEYLDGSVGNKFVTSSSASQAFAGKRSLGFQYTGWNNKIWYAGGIFADKGIANGTKAGDQGYAFSGRFAYSPLREYGKIFHLGLAGTYRKADAAGFEYDDENNVIGELPRTIDYSSNSETVVDSRKFISAKVKNAKDQFRFSAELLGAFGPVYIQSEYFQAHARREKADLHSYNGKGFYSQVGVLALGGKYSYDAKLARMLRSKPKSLEFLVRYSWTDLNDSDAQIMGGKQSDFTVAANYYFSRYLNFRLNYINVGLDKNSLVGKERFNAVSARIQMLF